MTRFHEFDARSRLAKALAEKVGTKLRAAIDARGRATLVVSGGTTPEPFLRCLREQDLPWGQVDITLADERWVPPGDPESNERLIRETLLHNGTAAARFVGLYQEDQSLEVGCRLVDPTIAALRPFDVVVLGMGGDGHTASLFPGVPGLSSALEWDSPMTCFAVRHPDIDPPRITLGVRALLDGAPYVVLHIVGDWKQRVYRRACEAGPEAKLPIRALLRRAPAGIDVYWAP